MTKSVPSSDAKSNVLRNSLLSGSVAGISSTIVCYPFDVLRIKMQTSAFEAASAGVVGTFRHTIQAGGFRALYVGLALPLGAQAIYKGTVFSVNNLTTEAISEWKSRENHQSGRFGDYKLTMTDRFLCGFMGGAVNAALFVTPVEYIRNQLINEQGSTSGDSKQRLRGPISVIKSTLAHNGMAGLWRGMTSTVLRDSIGCGFFFVAMSWSQHILSPDELPTFPVVVCSGAFAGVSFWLWALPVDTMKTWIQNGTAKNLRHAAILASRQGIIGGIYSLSRGWQLAYGRGAPSAAITVTSYSLAYQFLSH
jgi:hypothetical protein